jgi:gliding motility-associated protein GldM
MAGGKQTPRQRMINILYLVLLGLIALNVPDNLLDAFKKIGDSLSTSNTNVQTGINNTFDAFEKTKLKEQPDRAKPIYDKAKSASKVADDLNTYIESLKKEIVDKSGGFDEKINDYRGRDNMDVTPHVMIEGEKATELKKKINAAREELINTLDPKDRQGVNLSLSAVDPPERPGVENKDWEHSNFGEGVPVGAAITALIKIQSDAKNAENEVVKKELGKVDQAVVTLDKFVGVAVAPSSYIIAGSPYKAQVFLTAYDSKSTPDIVINGSRIPAANGVGTYTVNTSREGIFTYAGKISVKGPDGVKTYDLPKQTYQVAKPSAVVSPEKMNVLYIGVPNPLAVSAPGVPLDKLRVSMSNGSVSGSNGKFSAKVSSAGTTTITISGEVAPGKSQVLGTSQFRIKRIPDPIAQFAGKSGGTTSSVNLRSADRLFAHLDNFEFDAHFNITRFKMYIQKPRQDVVPLTTSGADLSGAMKAALSSITPGTLVVFDDIVAVGPDGTPRQLNTLTLRAN